MPLNRAFVTGGSGFLGRNLIRFLVERGIRVAGLARSDAAAATVREAGAEPVRGDLDDVAAMAAGAGEADAFFHSAAKAEEWGDPAEFERINVQGTRNAVDAARQARVRRFVHVGTEAVLAGGPLVQVDESQPKPARPAGLYPSSKARAEDVVLAANGNDLETVVCRPRFIWGRDDTSVLALLVQAVKDGRFRWIDGGRYLTSTCHVTNVCHGLVLAAEKGVPGAIYFLTDGEPRELRPFLTRMLQTQGVDPGGRSVPRWLAAALAGATEPVWRLLRLKKPPPITRTALCLFGSEVTVRDDKARRELGYAPLVSVEDGLREMEAASPRPA